MRLCAKGSSERRTRSSAFRGQLRRRTHAAHTATAPSSLSCEKRPPHLANAPNSTRGAGASTHAALPPKNGAAPHLFCCAAAFARGRLSGLACPARHAAAPTHGPGCALRCVLPAHAGLRAAAGREAAPLHPHFDWRGVSRALRRRCGCGRGGGAAVRGAAARARGGGEPRQPVPLCRARGLLRGAPLRRCAHPRGLRPRVGRAAVAAGVCARGRGRARGGAALRAAAAFCRHRRWANRT